jgi:hypothetical protein
MTARETEQTMAAPDDLAARTPAFRLPPEPSRGLESIGDYQVIDKLGQGGMGAVYRARQARLDRVVALKILPAQFEEDADYVARFQREATLAASLNHPNLVRVYAAGQADGCHYIAMELVEGENLRQRLKRGGLSMAESLRICADVARGLQCGWERAQLIHRDIKPSNIYLSQTGEVKLGDLGLAKSALSNTTGLTQTGAALGTPHYMSPEQVRGDKNLDFRADIYSLGCALYELLTGQPPYHGSDGLTIMRQHLDSPLPAILKVLPGCPILLVRLVGKMLKKHRNERPTSYEDLIAELEWVREQIEHPASTRLVGTAVPSRPPPGVKAERTAETAVPTTPSERKANPGVWLALAAGVLVLGAVAFVLVRPAKSPDRGLRQPAAAVEDRSPLRGAADRAQQAAPPPSGSKLPQSIASGAGWQRTDFATAALGPLGKNATKEGDTLHLQDNATHGAGITVSNGAVRATFVNDGSMRNVRVVTRMGHGQYYASVWGDHLDVVYQGPPNTKTLKSFRHPALPPKDGEEVTFQLASIGSTHSVWLNGQLLGTVEDATSTQPGSLAIQALDGRFKSMEWINLDGLPEAEALKLAGVSASSPAPSADNASRDLLTDLDLSRAALKGTWKKVADGIELEKPNGPGMIEFSDPAPSEYEFEAEFTPTGPGNNINFHLTMAGHPFAWKLNAHGRTPPLYGIDLLDGRKCSDFPEGGVTRDLKLETGRRYSSRVEVRARSVTAYVNGEQFFTWSGDPQRLSLEEAMRLRDPQHLGLGSWDRGVIFHRATVRTLNQPGASAAVSTSLPVSSSVATATKDAPFVNSLGMKFVLVPITGGPTDGQRVRFCITETRVEDYEVFVKETKREWPKPEFKQGPTHPAVNVSWDDATAFCAWLTERERKEGKIDLSKVSYRLPTDHEWSCAVGIGDQEDAAMIPDAKHQKLGGIYPWGTAWVPPKGTANFGGEELLAVMAAGGYGGRDFLKGVKGYTDGYVETAPVGSFPADAHGLHDLSGNVWEWCADWVNPAQESAGKATRGGCWASGNNAELFSSTRSRGSLSLRNHTTGFRVVLAPAP